MKTSEPYKLQFLSCHRFAAESSLPAGNYVLSMHGSLRASSHPRRYHPLQCRNNQFPSSCNHTSTSVYTWSYFCDRRSPKDAEPITWQKNYYKTILLLFIANVKLGEY